MLNLQVVKFQFILMYPPLKKRQNDEMIEAFQTEWKWNFAAPIMEISKQRFRNVRFRVKATGRKQSKASKLNTKSEKSYFKVCINIP